MLFNSKDIFLFINIDCVKAKSTKKKLLYNAPPQNAENEAAPSHLCISWPF